MITRASLVGRLLALAVVWAIPLLAAGGVALTMLYHATVFGDVDERLDRSIEALESGARLDDDGRVRLARTPGDDAYEEAFSGWYWLVGLVGPEANAPEWRIASTSVWDASVELEPGVLRRALARRGDVFTGRGVGPEGQRLRARVGVVSQSGAEQAFVIVAAMDRREAEAAVRGFAIQAGWMLLILAALLLGVIWFQVRYGLRPLFQMQSAVAQIREGERERLDVDNAPAELASLAEELNALLDHNRDVVDRARAHVGNLAHALKTPISVILNESRRNQAASSDLISRQAEAMARQVDHHLKRASAAARAQSVGARTDAAAVILDIARILPRMHPDAAIELRLDLDDALAFRGERQDFEELAGNLLDNAFKWSGGRVRVRLQPAEGANRLRLVVEDDGPGLEPEQRATALKRGARLDEAAPGSGLGLAIVQDLARAYGGSLSLETSDLGGLAAIVELPAARRIGARGGVVA